VLYYQKSRFDVFNHKTKTGYASGRAPNLKVIVDHPDTEMYFRTFDGRRQFDQDFCGQGQRTFK
jgi:hypothetical protein